MTDDADADAVDAAADNATLSAAAAALDGFDNSKSPNPPASSSSSSSINPATSHLSYGVNASSLMDPKTKENSMENKKKQMKAEMESDTSWRGALWKLRALFPGGGNFHGVGVPLDPNTLLVNEGGYGDGNGMWSRIQEMRRTQDALNIIAEKNASRLAALDASERNRIQSIATRVGKSKGGSGLHTIHSFSEGEFMDENSSYKQPSLSQRQRELDELNKGMNGDEGEKETSPVVDPITATTTTSIPE